MVTRGEGVCGDGLNRWWGLRSALVGMSTWWCKVSSLYFENLNSFFFSFFFSKNFLNVYFWDREKDRVWVGEGQRGRHKIRNRLQALSHQHSALCGAWTHKWQDHDLSWSRMLNWLSHAGAPEFLIFHKQWQHFLQVVMCHLTLFVFLSTEKIKQYLSQFINLFLFGFLSNCQSLLSNLKIIYIFS